MKDKSTFSKRLKVAWRILFPLSEEQQQKVFAKRQKEQLMEGALVDHIVKFYVNSVAYNLYAEASKGNIDPNFFDDLLSETIVINGLQGSMKDILTVQIKEAVADGYLNVEDEDDLGAYQAIPIDLSEKGKAYIITEVIKGMTDHFQNVIDKVNDINIEFESDEVSEEA